MRGIVLAKLDKKNPVTPKGYRKAKHHSLLSEEVGLPAVRKQIWEVNAVMKVSPNKRKFEGLFGKLMGQAYQTDAFDEDLQ
jgi:hypothetical protein